MRSDSALVSAVVDTNLVVSGVIRRGRPYRLLQALRERRFSLLLTQELYDEYNRVLVRPKLIEKYGLSTNEITDLLVLISTSARFVTPSSQLPLAVRDPEDDMVLAAALGGHADYLVTGDRDLLELRGRPELGALQIVTVAEFLEILGE